jgi:CheY-like chemotaxis protein
MKNKKILLVEDELKLLGRLSARLEEWGYNVTLASDGQEAWDLIESALNVRWEALLVDFDTPGMDGGELGRNISKLFPCPFRKIVLVSSLLATNPKLGVVIDELCARLPLFYIPKLEIFEKKTRLQQILEEEVVFTQPSPPSLSS